MMRTTSAYVVAALVLAVAAGPAAAHDLTVRNNTDQALTSISVRPGQIANFRRMPSKSQKTFGVTLPAGQCKTMLTARLEDGQTARTEANLCGGFMWTLGLNIH